MTAGTDLHGGDDPTALSTAPAPVPSPGHATRRGPGRAPVAPVVRAWRQLTSMRSALLLLFLLALAAVPGSLLPQRGLNPIKVNGYFADHPRLAPLLDRFSLFDVFAAPWFAAIYLLLFISLAGCLGPRIRLHLRGLRAAPPAAPRHLDRLPVSAGWAMVGDPEAVAEHAERVLRGRRWRVIRRTEPGGEVTLAAEKGHLRETGNLLFHLSLLVLLVGVAVGGLFGYKGSVLVKEGDGFSNSVGQYDSFTPGRAFRQSTLAPFRFTLDDFRATYLPNGQPRSFDAVVTYFPVPDAAGHRYDVRVNHPLDIGGTKTYLIGHGYAPRVVVRDGTGAVAFDGTVPCLPQDKNFKSLCTVKVPDARPEQLGFSGFFTPTSVRNPATGIESGYPAPNAPGLTLLASRGDLGLDSGVPQSVYRLDTKRLTPVGSRFLAPGDVFDLPSGGSIAFTGLEEWATFQVARDPGKGTALLASIGVVVGLLLSLRVRRRRVWVRLVAAPDPPAASAGGGARPGRTVVTVGGLARSEAERFAAEFTVLAAALRDAPAEPGALPSAFPPPAPPPPAAPPPAGTAPPTVAKE